MTEPTPLDDTLPEDVAALIGQYQYEKTGDFPVEQGYVWTSCASVFNGNPVYWDAKVAEEVTGGPISPPSLLSAYARPHYWAPGAEGEQLSLQVHFDLKKRFGLPEAIMTDNTNVFYEPVRMGDLIRSRQVLKSVSGEKRTKLGIGRFWVIDVEYHNQNGELLGTESYTGYGYRREASA
ncbi:FAS1-like dehydratase domain-containing protein [Yinghuangia seranimata]|uniref:FAS1-like dehydratase domain-containing protein n=1 Tax=Yinghuangia seranimata TaxID=408067 RepID=UPI00248AB374|nr:MaoC family dehydratase N-terminal domain-containing protein [Yinghuangia seranimata]MDI2130337.1 MaoC family dehydratase N-terminal domain-containing protein [Yinghuangia seranimata]